MGLDSYSNRTSGYYSEAFTQWGSQESWPEFQSALQETPAAGRPRSSSFAETKVDAVMEEFRMNGFDSPYDPEEERNLYKHRNNAELTGMGPPSMYLRQKSWPAPDASPSIPLPNARESKRRNAGEMFLAASGFQAKAEKLAPSSDVITEQQLRVLSTLPNSVLYNLLRELEQARVQLEAKPAKQPEVVECRFCKNNGERESYYRSHRLRWRGKVVCPVLRNYRCRRCGAKGDSAHTLKYCPLASADERQKSNAMMQSVRARRTWQTPSSDIASEYVVMGEATPSVITDGAYFNSYEPLDPIWEALAKKLML
ncbi:uncharacterized protein LOC120623353 isoform X1 [Pararge aegeria]|uniref:uncharacterized protein LOC120623353 isoform X1 n=2 Tax=Pararge aegeria TaxID=116150 RepID=UPI0019D07E0E|nr:uncharacterized protein LOC120623353 isoform X1 [Pararge aegeria]